MITGYIATCDYKGMMCEILDRYVMDDGEVFLVIESIEKSKPFVAGDVYPVRTNYTIAIESEVSNIRSIFVNDFSSPL